MEAKYGAENVYDFSLGNPATSAPASLNDAIRDLLDESDAVQGGSLTLHGYMENAGYPDVREAVARNLNKRFGTKFDFHNIIMTVGAAGGLNIIFKTILDPGDEVMVFAPFSGSIASMQPILAQSLWRYSLIWRLFVQIFPILRRRSQRGQER